MSAYVSFTGILLFSALLCDVFEYSDGQQGMIWKPVHLAEEKSINHGCPSWFVPDRKNSNHCKCGEPVSHTSPGRTMLCDPNTKQTLLLIGSCMDYDEDEDVVFVSGCPFINQNRVVDAEYVKPPKNASELNQYLCGGLNRTGVLCSQCQEGLGTAIFSYSMQCLPCMNSGLGWTLYVFLATFPTTILFLFLFIFQVRITSGPLNAYIFACQLIVSTVNLSITFESTSFSHGIVLTLCTVYGIWNLDFFRYVIFPFCASNQISPLQVIALEYTVAFYPLLLTAIAYICVQLHARDCRVMVCLWRVFCKCFGSCRRRWGRQWDPAASLVHKFAAFLLLSYSKILFVSLQLLSYTKLHIPTGRVSLSSFLHLFCYCIQPNLFRSVLGAVVEDGLHYMHLLMSSRVATRMVPTVQGTVDTLQDFTLFFE